MDAARFSMILTALFAAAFFAVVLSGCAGHPKDEPQVVKVSIPVAVAMTPPGELMTPFKPREPLTFVSPKDPDALVALTPDGARRLRLLVFDLNARLAAWQAWATKPKQSEVKQ